MDMVFWGEQFMIRIFKWWWAWNYEQVEEWLEKMEAGGLRLVETRFNGLVFYFEKCKPSKARYCIDYQNRLTPDYLTIISDDGWQLYQLGWGWYILRKVYEDERPEFYTDFEGLIARNKSLLNLVIILALFEVVCIANLVYNTCLDPSMGWIAYTAIFGTITIALFTFIITNLVLQIKKFKERKH